MLHLTPSVLLESVDAAELKVGDEFTLRNWCNVVVTAVEEATEGKGAVVTGTLNVDGSFKTTELKATWVPDSPNALPVVLHEFDYLITKDKLLPEDVFEDYVRGDVCVDVCVCVTHMQCQHASHVIPLRHAMLHTVDAET